MSRYYNVYQSMTPKRGLWVVVIAVILIAALALSLAIAFWLVPMIHQRQAGDTVTPSTEENIVGGETAELIVLSAPAYLALDSTKTRLSWSCADNLYAIRYQVKINGVITNVYDNPVTVNLMEGINSVISVKAIGDNIVYSESPWSDELTVYKEDGLLIAYQTILSSMRSILDTNVRYGTAAIETGEIFAINDLGNYTANVWYTFASGEESGLACTTVSVPSLGGITYYKDTISQISAVINNNDLTTVFMPDDYQDMTAALLSRSDLTGRLNTLKQQGYKLTTVCANTSGATVSDGVATIKFRGILRAEKGNIVKFFSYDYSASMAEISGFTSQNYINQLLGTAVTITFTEATPTIEATVLAKEMLSIYLLQQEDEEA